MRRYVSCKTQVPSSKVKVTVSCKILEMLMIDVVWTIISLSVKGFSNIFACLFTLRDGVSHVRPQSIAERLRIQSLVKGK